MDNKILKEQLKKMLKKEVSLNIGDVFIAKNGLTYKILEQYTSVLQQPPIIKYIIQQEDGMNRGKQTPVTEKEMYAMYATVESINEATGWTWRGVNADGTHLIDYYNTSYAKLVKAFGVPDEGDGYKSSSEWAFKSPTGSVFTIYDWKSTELYEPGYPSVEEFRKEPSYEWHIGGKVSKSSKEYLDFLNFLKSRVYNETTV